MPVESSTVLLAGAAGGLGRHVLQEVRRRGYHVRALVNRTPLHQPPDDIDIHQADANDAGQLRGACDGAQVMISALGASVLPDFKKGRRSYSAVDTVANRNLITAAQAAGVRKFIYVSVATG